MKINNLGKSTVFSSILAFSVFLLQANLSYAQNPTLPQGGTSVAGNVTYNYSGNTLNQNTTATRSISNYNNMSLGSGYTWNINQPSNGVSLNRAVGVDPSLIYGNINSQGQVFLVNPNGILFGAGSQVNAPGLLASTLDIANSDFLAGKYNFYQNGKPSWIINQGHIHISNGGYVALLSNAVNNSGVIEAQLGHVLLASGEAMTVGLDDDNTISVDITAAVSNGVFGPDGVQITDAIKNSGSITADGGTILLTAKILNGIFDNAINNTGVIQANSLVNNDGTIELVSTGSGTVINSGTIRAKGSDAGTTGGTVKLLGEDVGLLGGLVDVSGDVGGGTVLIGGNFQGMGPEENADATYVSPDALINADAITQGNGGKVIIWANNTNRFYGNISARGGILGGNGGFAEVSGANLDFQGTVNLDAPLGTSGTLLLDPKNLNVISSGATPYTGNNLFANSPAGSLSISPASIEAVVGTITLQANNDVTITDAIVLSTIGQSIEIDAGRSILLNNSITTTNTGAITLLANDSAATVVDRTAGNGSITMASSTPVLSTGTLSLTIDPTSTGGFNPGSISIAGAITAGTLNVSNTTGPTTLSNANNAISYLGAIAATGRVFSLTDNVAAGLAENGVVAVGTLNLTNTGNIDLSSQINLVNNVGTVNVGSSNTFSVQNGQALGETAGGSGITAGTLNVTNTSGATTLDNSGNAINNLGTITAAGRTFTLTDNLASGLAQNGVLTAKTLNLTNTLGNINLSSQPNAIQHLGNISAAGNTVSLVDTIAVDQAAATTINAGTLNLTTTKDGGANITLTNTGNTVTNIDLQSRNTANTANDAGAIQYTGNGGYTVAGLATTGAASLIANGTVGESGPISAGTLSVTNTGGDTTLTNFGNAVSHLGNISAGGNTFSLIDTTAVDQASATTINAGVLVLTTLKDGGANITLTNTGNNAGNINLQSLNTAGNTTDAGTISYTGSGGYTVAAIDTTGTANLTANGTVIQSSGPINAGTLSLTNAGGSTTLTNAGNAISHLGNISAAGNAVSLIDTTAVDQASATTINAGTLNLTTTKDGGANITLTNTGNTVTNIDLQSRNTANTANDAGTIAYTGAAGYTVAGIATTGAASLIANGIVGESGPINVGTLNLTNTAGTDFTTQANAIQHLGNISAAGNTVSVVDTTAVDQAAATTINAGTLALTTTKDGGANITLTNTGNTVTNVNLQSRNTANSANDAGTIAYTGNAGYTVAGIATTGAASLIANGIVGESGPINVGTLNLTNTAGTDFTTQANAIQHLGNISAAGNTVSVVDTTAVDQAAATTISAGTLNLTTTLDGGANITLTNTGNTVTNIDLQSRNTANTANDAGIIQYTGAGGFTVAGLSTTGAASLIASGTVGESGPINVGTLNLTNTAGTDFTTQANTIQHLGNISAAGNAVSLIDTTAVDQASATTINAGTLNLTTTKDGGANITLTNTGNTVTNIDLQSRNTANTANAAGTIAYTGAGGYTVAGIATTGTASLIASGVVGESGPISAGTLNVTNTAGNTTFDNSGNAINALGVIDAAGQTFTLTDNVAGELTQSGALTANTLVLTNTASGTTLTNSGNAVNVFGAIDAAGQTFTFADHVPALTQSGPLTAALLNLSNTGTITLDNPGNAISEIGTIYEPGQIFTLVDNVAGGLTQGGPWTIGTLVLTNTASSTTLDNSGNAINVLGTIDAAGQTFTLTDNIAGGLTQSGVLTAGTLSLTNTASDTNLSTQPNVISNLGTINAGGNTFSLNDTTALGESGALTANILNLTNTADTTLNNSGNAINELGTINVGANTFALTDNVSGGLTQTLAGSITAGTLSLTNTAGSTTLNNLANAINALGTINATGQIFSLTDNMTTGLTQTGSLKAGILNLTNTAGDTTLNNSGNAVNNLGTINAAGHVFSLTDNVVGGLNQSGVLTAATLNLTNTVSYTNLSTQPNKVGTLGTIDAGTQTFYLWDTQALNESGVLTAGLLNLTNTSGTTNLNQNNLIQYLGTINASGQTFILNNSESLGETGSIAAKNLLLEGNGTFNLNSTINNVTGSLAANITGGDLVFTNNGALTVGNVNSVNGITTAGGDVDLTSAFLKLNNDIDAGAGTVTLTADGATEVGGGVVNAANLALIDNGSPFEADFTMNGVNDVTTLAADINGALKFNNGSHALTVGDVSDANITTVDGITTNSIVANGYNAYLSSGSLTLSDNITVGTSIITLNTTTGGIDQTGGILTSGGLLLTGTGTDTLTDANIDGTIAGNVNGSVTYTDAGPLTVGTVTGNAGSFSGITITGSTGALILNAVDGITLDNDVTTSGTQEYNGNVTLGGNRTLTGTTVTFDDLLDGAKTLDIEGNAVFTGAVGSSAPLTSLYVNGTSAINGGSVKTGTTQKYHGNVTLGAGTTLTGTTVTFDNLLDGAETLDIEGNAVFTGAVGSSAPLTSLYVNGTSAINGGSVKTGTTQKYHGNVTLGAGTTLTGTTVTFDNLLDGAETLDIEGNAVFTGAVGSSAPLTSLYVNGTSAINGGSVKTGTTQKYHGNVTLGAGTTLTGTTVTFDNLLDGAETLDIEGNAVFTGAVGSSTPLTSLYVNGTSAINGGSVKTGTTQKYHGNVTLGAGTTLTGTTVTFDNLLDGAETLDIEGNAVFTGAVGSSTPLTSLYVNGTSAINGGSVKTGTTQKYHGNVTLGAGTTLTGTTVTFDNLLDGAETLDIEGNAVFTGAVGSSTPLTSLYVNGTSAINGGSVKTTGFQTYTGPITLGVNDTLTGKNITFSGTTATIDALTNGGESLTISDAAGTTIYGGAVGSNEALSSLTDTSAAININGGSVKTTGFQTYTGPITLGVNDILTGKNITFTGTTTTIDALTNGGESLTISDPAGTTIYGGAVGSNEALSSLTDTSAAIDINGGSVKTTGFQTYTGPITLGVNDTLTGKNITFTGTTTTIDALTNGGESLTISDPAGTTIYGGTVGHNKALSSLTDTSAAIDINGGSVTTTGFQTYTGPITLGVNDTLTGKNITFTGTTTTIDALTNGGESLTISDPAGTTIYGGAVGHNKALSSLTDTSAAIDINGGSVKTTGFQTYTGPITLGVNDTLTGKNITFIGTTTTIDALTNGGESLTISDPAGTTIYGGAVGSNEALSSLTDTSAAIDINGGSVKTTGFQTYTGPITLGVNDTLTGDNITFTGTTTTIDALTNGGESLTISDPAGTTIYGGAVGHNKALSSLTDTSAAIDINGGSVKTTGFQTYTGPITLGVNDTLTGKNITFTGTTTTIDALTNGGESLTISDPAGTTIYGGAVGHNKALSSLTDTSAAIDINGGSVKTTGFQTYTGPITLGVNDTLTGKNITFTGTTTTIDALTNGGESLTISDPAGTTIYGGAVGSNEALSSLTDTSAAIDINGGSVKTTGFQTYTGPITFGVNDTLTGDNITFTGTTTTIDALTNGGESLTISDPAGTTIYGGAVGHNKALSSLTDTSAAIDINGGSVKTTGFQTYTGPITLGVNDTLTGKNITFTGTTTTIDALTNGGESLTISDPAGTTIYGGAVGSNEALSSLTDTSAAIDINGGSVTTTGFQTYTGPITLGVNDTLTGKNITFTGTTTTIDALTNGGESLTISDPAGTTTYGGAVGSIHKLSTLTDTSAAIDINGGSVTTTGLQTYTGPLTLGANTTLIGDDITFNNTVDSSGISFFIFNFSFGNTLNINDAGITIFNGAVGGVYGLGSLTDTSAAIEINGGSINTTSLLFAGFQTYTGPITLGNDTTLTGKNITFTGTATTIDALTNGGESLTISDAAGTTIYGGAVGSNEALSSLTDTSAAIDINGGSVKTTGFQTYTGPITLGVNDTLTGKNITFTGTTTTIDALTNGGESLTISDPAGTTIYGGAVGHNKALSSLTDTSAAININGGSVKTTGFQTYTGPITLGVNDTLTGDNITFTGTTTTIDALTNGGESLTISDPAGTTIYGGAVGHNKALSRLTDTSAAIDINGGSVKTTGFQTYKGPITLGVNDTLTGKNITFTGTTTTIDALTNGGESLTISDPAGTTIYGGAVGSNEALSSLTDTSAAIDINGGSVTTTGFQTYTGPITLGVNDTLTGDGITFNSTLDSNTGLEGLTINDSGTTQFNGEVGIVNDPLAYLTINDPISGNIVINTHQIDTFGAQYYGKPVILDTSSTLTGDDITFNSTLDSEDGSEGLEISDSGTTTFNGEVGIAVNPLSYLTIDPTGVSTVINTDKITTSGAQDYGNPVTLDASSTLSGADITFESTLDSNTGAEGLEIHDSGTTTFDDQVGNNINPLSYLTIDVTGGNTVIGTDVINTSGAQYYGNAVTLDTSSTLTGDGITFNSTLDSNTGLEGLTINDSGTTQFNGEVGIVNDPLAYLTINDPISGNIVINTHQIDTFGAQYYGKPVILDTSSTLTGDDITFNSTLDSEDGSEGLEISDSGTTTFNGEVGIAVNPLSYLTIDPTGVSTVINTDKITTSGAQDYGNPVTLDASSTLSGADITFESTLDSNTGAEGLIIKDSGTTVFDDVIGGITPLADLTVNTGHKLTIAHNINVTGTVILNPATGGVTETSGAIIAANLLLTGNGVFDLNNANNDVDTIAANINGPLTYQDSDTLTVGGPIDGISGITTTNNDVTLTAADDLNVGIIDAGTGNVDLTATNGSILDDSSLITGNNVTLNATATTSGNGNVGLIPAGPITVNSNSLTVNAGGDVNVDSTGDILIDTVQAGGGVELVSTNGSINGNPAFATNVTAHGDSLFSAPNGTIGVTGGPVSVDIIGNLVLDIGTRVGLDSGFLTGVVNSATAQIPLVLPSVFPSPLYPPGNIFFNGVRIWPSESEFELSQASSGLLSRFVFPSAQSLALTQVNTFDPSTSSGQSGGTGLFLYHPLEDVDSGAFDQEFQLDEGAYDFIDGEILKKGH